VKVFYVIARHKETKATGVPSYYSGLSVFSSLSTAKRRIRTLKRRDSEKDYRVLPWHSEMGEIDVSEMWRSALSVE
tara:strand:- start:819 stop:1046 length:228 start_codon:yes stop_codon:yes gene_type:complete